MKLSAPRLIIVAVLFGLLVGLVPPSALPLVGDPPRAAAAASEMQWTWKITGWATDSRTVHDHEYTSERSIEITGSATVRRDADGNTVAEPFQLTLTDESQGTKTRTCANGTRSVEVWGDRIIDASRYSGGPDGFLNWPAFAEPHTDLDGSRYVPNPFGTAFYSNGEISRVFTYQYDLRDPNCGTARNHTSQFEGVGYRITNTRTVGDLTPGADGTVFSWQGNYTLEVQDVFAHFVPMAVTVRVEARWLTPQSSPTPTPSPSPSPSPNPPGGACVPVGTRQLMVTTTGAGTVTPGSGEYPHCAVVTLEATPAAGQLLVGWTVDGLPAGHANPLTIRLDRDRTVAAAFTALPTYSDVTATTPYAGAIGQLAARGIIRGYGDGRFGPGDGTLRAQMAALICRAMGWDGEDHGNPFSDRGVVDADLWRNVGTLAHYGVARGYGDGTYGPTAPVLNAQAVSFVTRAMVARGYWQPQPDNPALYPNVPASSGHREDIATYVHYAGALPGTADTNGAWNWYAQPSTRSWFAEALWRALDSHLGVDRVP